MSKKNVTMSDIAKEMGVSTVTVSKALGDKDGVGSELRARIKEKAQEMEQAAKELTLDQLDQVSGAGSPFDEIPRVPTNPIDNELRKDG